MRSWMELWEIKQVILIKSILAVMVKVHRHKVQLNLPYFRKDSKSQTRQSRKRVTKMRSNKPNVASKTCQERGMLGRIVKQFCHKMQLVRLSKTKKLHSTLKIMKRRFQIQVHQSEMKNCKEKKSKSKTKIEIRSSQTLR